MCDICHSVPCRARCPNAAAKTVEICAFCHSGIEEGDRFFTDKYGNTFCSDDCALEFHGILEETEV